MPFYPKPSTGAISSVAGRTGAITLAAADVSGVSVAMTTTVVKTTTYTIGANELVPCDATSAGFTVTLPNAPADKTRIIVKKIDTGTNLITVACAGSDVLNKTGGATSLTLTLPSQAATLQYATSGAIWYITADDMPLSQLDARLAPIWGTPGPGYNINPTNFPKFRKGLARVRAGTGKLLIACVGDSTTAGATVTSYSQAYPSILTATLNSYFAPTVNNWMSTQAVNGHDPRIALTGAWAFENTNGSLLGGDIINNSSADTGTITYTPTHTHDSIDIYWLRNSGKGSFSWAVDGGSATTVSTAGTAGIGKTTISGLSLTTHTLVLAHVAGAGDGIVYIGHVRAYDSTTTGSKIEVVNCGLDGSRVSTTWNASLGYSPKTFLTTIAPDLTIIDLGKNDAGSSVSVASFTSTMQTLITAAQASGDVLIKSMSPSSGSPYTTYEPQYVAAMKALAVTNNCGFLDAYNRWGGSYTTYNTLGYYTDGLHPNAIGYADTAQAVYEVLTAF